MALTLSVDLNNANLADLTALLASARRLGAGDDAELTLDGSTLYITIEDPQVSPKRPPRGLDFRVGDDESNDVATESVDDIPRSRRRPRGPQMPGFSGPSGRNPRGRRNNPLNDFPFGRTTNPLEFLDMGDQPQGVDDLVDAGKDAVNGIIDFITGRIDESRGSGRNRRHTFGSFRDAFGESFDDSFAGDSFTESNTESESFNADDLKKYRDRDGGRDGERDKGHDDSDEGETPHND